MTTTDIEKLPYRPCVGVMLLNKEGRIWLGRRVNIPGNEGRGHWWQMPQGGIDEGEDSRAAALRELHEETSIRSAEFIEEAPDWYYYDLPPHLVGVSWGGKYRGQKQRWVALRFTGDDSEIDVSVPGHRPEFDDWRWARLDELAELIVPFKRAVYEQVTAAFRHLAR